MGLLKKKLFYCLVRIQNPKIFTKIKLPNQCSLTELIALVEKKRDTKQQQKQETTKK